MSIPPLFKVVQGHKFCPDFKDQNIVSGLSYQARPDDLFIVTYPKNGTTWMQQIVTLILNQGEVPEALRDKGLNAVSPFLEKDGKEAVESFERPFSIKSHLPYHLQPKHPDAKYIIVMRNPKDACVSFFHHYRLRPHYQLRDKTIHEFFPLFINGDVEGGCYFDWQLSWWKHKDEGNILFVLYEDMKSDTEGSILKVASFMDDKYRDQLLANDKKILKKVIDNSSFSFMSDMINPVTSNSTKEEYKFIRKGIVGDWMSHFSKEENDVIEKKFKDKFTGTGLDTFWDKYSIFPSFQQN